MNTQQHKISSTFSVISFVPSFYISFGLFGRVSFKVLGLKLSLAHINQHVCDHGCQK